MRRTLSPSMALGLLVGAACVAATSSERLDHARANAPASAALNPARPADRQMLAYGEANPECRMWTNWQKLCSRTGPGGAVHCDIDRARRVAPSLPFCAASRSETPASVANDAERELRERFCVSHRMVEDLVRHRLVRVCTRHDPRRPFNGRRVAALLHPGCDGLSDAETGQPFCARGGGAAAGLPDCAALAARGYQHGRLLQCRRWSGDPSCHAFPVRGAPDTGEDAMVIPRDPNRAGVHGLFCENR